MRKLYISHYSVPKTWPKEAVYRENRGNKLQNIYDKIHVFPSPVKILNVLFLVSKGENDIIMVYDVKKCGFNSDLWAHNFGLTTSDYNIRNTNSDEWFGDINLGENVLN